MRETIRWQADAGGVTPIAVTGTGALTSNRVRLQSASELAANTGTGASLSGDGVALELDLSTITTSRILTLINNQSSDFIQGFFEKGTSTSLYAEGAAILDTGFNGTVNISYIGGTGNDVVLNLIAATIPGDHNADGGVDARDYVVWRKTASANIQGYLDWRANFGASSGTGQTIAAAIPEPATAWFAFIAASLMLGAPAASRSRRVIAKNARGVLMTAMTLPPPVSNEPNAKPALRRSLWKIARPLLLAYLVIVLGMMFFETSLVYPIPDPSSGDWQPKSFQFEDVHFNSADGTKLHGWFVPHPSPARAILYCHGNGEDVSSHGELAAVLSKIYRASVFVFDYRGYGHSEGRPSEAGCIADGSAAQHWLAERMGIRPNDVVLMGRSLGSAVAIALAADNGARALVIENAFPTMTDVAASHYPWLPVRWIMTNRYDNLTRIQRYAGPLLQSHGANDELIPLPFARRLFDIAPSVNKRWMEFPGLGHNSAMPGQYYDQLAKFLDASATDASLSKPR